MDARDGVSLKRRQFLVTTVTVLGGFGLVAASVPFVSSWWPSAAAKAAGAPVTVDASRVDAGMLLTVEWRGKPVWILHRTDSMLRELGRHDSRLRDPQSREPQQPEYARNATRSIKPRNLVVVGICTHLGCVPLFRPDVASSGLGSDWPGGFACPCHGSRFDLAGRVFQNVPAPLNLVVPPHRYVSETVLLIGEDRTETT